MHSANDPQLESLFSALADGSLGEQGQHELERRLTANPADRREFLSWMAMESVLEWGVGPIADSTAERHPPRAEWKRRGILATGLAGATLAAIAVAVFLSARAPDPGAQAARSPVASISDLRNARWQDDRQWQIGEGVAAGPLRLTAGSAQVAFASGAKVALTAPAEVEVLSANRLFLRSGSITPFVPTEARGFTVVCPSGEVVDLGTEFSMRVGPDGKADVYVIDGEVDVAAGHGAVTQRLRLTQGLGSTLSTTASPSIGYSVNPLIVDRFDGTGPAVAGCSLLQWSTYIVDRDCPAEVRDGSLQIPIDGGADRRYPIVRVAVENEVPFLGQRIVIAVKVTLPNGGAAGDPHRWAGIVIDDGSREELSPTYKPQAALGVLVSPSWQVELWGHGQRVGGHHRVFARDADAIGPYQVVMVLDDTPTSYDRHGSATASVMVNGLEVMRNHPIALGAQPRLQFQSHTKHRAGGRGVALIDDLSVSLDETTLETLGSKESSLKNP
jgi:ferric-dicitrate binding protein FerR (iron transport regulator)